MSHIIRPIPGKLYSLYSFYWYEGHVVEQLIEKTVMFLDTTFDLEREYGDTVPIYILLMPNGTIEERSSDWYELHEPEKLTQ